MLLSAPQSTIEPGPGSGSDIQLPLTEIELLVKQLLETVKLTNTSK
jgi:hypothetical protein